MDTDAGTRHCPEIEYLKPIGAEGDRKRAVASADVNNS
jgi:hypothetical protein